DVVDVAGEELGGEGRAVAQGEHPLAGIALGEEHLTRLEAPLPEPVGKRQQLTVGEFAEELHALQERRNVGGRGHQDTRPAAGRSPRDHRSTPAARAGTAETSGAAARATTRTRPSGRDSAEHAPTHD